MPKLFHQNMRDYTPGHPRAGRTLRYVQTFAQVGASAPAIEVAAFTEVLGRNDPNGAWPALAQALMGPGPHHVHVVHIGFTAVGRQNEYVVLVSRTPPLSLGRVMLAGAPVGGLALVPVRQPMPPGTPPATAAWLANRPLGVLADYRGVAYGVYMVGGRPIVVGALHNIWGVNDNRSALMQRLPDAMEILRGDPAAGVAFFPDVYVLGDYNAVPVVRVGGSLITLPVAQGIALQQAPPPTPPHWRLTAAQAQAGGRPGGTRLTGPQSLYDYAFHAARREPTAGIDVRTLDSWAGAGPDRMSDHVGAVLTL